MSSTKMPYNKVSGIYKDIECEESFTTKQEAKNVVKFLFSIDLQDF